MKKFILPIAVFIAITACIIPSVPGVSTPTALVKNTSTSSPPTHGDPLLPTSTPVLLNPTVTSSPPLSNTAVTEASSPTPNLTATFPTSTNAPAGNPSITPTATLAPGQPSLTPTLGILTYGTLPPGVPFNSITLWNRSKAQAYISLQVTMNDGRYAILEYPVEGQVKVKAPLGRYIYVAWVGGNKMTGSFQLSSSDSLLITLFKDKVVIN